MRMPADDRARLELDARLDHVLAGNAQVAILELGALQTGRLRVERARAERCGQTGDDQQLRSPHLPSPLGCAPCASGAMANTASLWRVRASLAGGTDAAGNLGELLRA